MVDVHAATSLRRSFDLGLKRGARSWAAVHRGPGERCSSRSFAAQRPGVRAKASRAAVWRQRAAHSQSQRLKTPPLQFEQPAGPRRARAPRHFRVELSSPTSLRRRGFRRSYLWRGWFGAAKPNERMQLTWLIGAPSQAGLGSPVHLRAGRPRLSRHAADAGR